MRVLSQAVDLDRITAGASNQMKNKKYHTVWTKIQLKIDTPNTQIHDCSFSWLGADTSIEIGGIKLVLWAQACHMS